MFKYKYSKLYWFLRKFEFLKVYFSPFKPFLPRLYIGKVAIGVPWFLPRNMKLNKETRRYEFIPKKIGFSFCGLGYKTKWTSTDYRHEWNPVWSFVFFGYQIALVFNAPEPYHYWTCWLYYNRNTDKNKTVKERIEQARKEYSNTWTRHTDKGKITTNYWDVVLKDVYNKQVNKG